MKTFFALCILALLGVALASPTGNGNNQQMYRDPQNGQWLSKQQYMQMYPYGMMNDNQMMYDSSSSYNGYNSNSNQNRMFNPYPNNNNGYNSNMYMTTTPRG